MTPTTPTGSRVTVAVATPGATPRRRSSASALGASLATYEQPVGTSNSSSTAVRRDFPVSSWSRSSSSSRRSATSSPNRSTIRARSVAGVSAHASCASRARSTAAFTSPASQAGTLPIRSSVAGANTSMRAESSPSPAGRERKTRSASPSRRRAARVGALSTAVGGSVEDIRYRTEGRPMESRAGGTRGRRSPRRARVPVDRVGRVAIDRIRRVAVDRIRRAAVGRARRVAVLGEHVDRFEQQ